MAQVANLLDVEEARLNALLDVTTPPPTNYEKYAIKKTLAQIGLMRQQPGETDSDYALRINLEAQKASPGYWSTAFFAQLDAAVASDTSEGSRGGRGRSD